MRVALVSCVKSKRAEPSAARDLYTSPLFRGMRAYAEANADEWYILSAEHGLLDPSIVIHPYERTLNKMKISERRKWAEDVQRRLEAILPPDAEVLMLAGQRYREFLAPYLVGRGHRVSVPFEGLPLGQQLRKLSRIMQAGHERSTSPSGRLLDEFVRVDRSDEGVRIHVLTISWKGPHTPMSEWVLWKQVTGEPDQDDLDRLHGQLLADQRYFRVCDTCNERKLLGWMHDADLCQSCAERHHGVVH